MERTIEQIQSEYGVKCAEAGHIQYQIDALTEQLSEIKFKLKSLNLEAQSFVKQGEEK